MWLLSVLLKFSRLTAASDFMKALAFPWFVVNVRPLCTKGSLKVVEEGKPDRTLMVRQVWEGSELCFFPLYLARLLCTLADLGACFKVLSAVFRYRPSEVVSSLNGGAELWR